MKKYIVSVSFLLFCITTYAQSVLPLTIEDPKMDSYLQNREPATLTIQINQAKDSIKSTDVKCVFVSFGSAFQITRFYKTDSRGYVKISLDQNLPYQQIWLQVGDFLYAGVYVNTDLKVTIDVNKIHDKEGVYMIGEGVAYSGFDGELNEVLNKHVLFKKPARHLLTSSLDELCRTRRKYTPDIFSTKTDSIWQAISYIDNEFIQLYPKYGWAIHNEAASEFYSMLCESYIGNTMPQNIFSKINKHQPYFTSNDCVLYYTYLNNYLNWEKSSLAQKIYKIDSIYHSPKAAILKTALLAGNKDYFAVTYPEILKSLQTGWCKRLVSNELTETAIKQKKIDKLLASAKKIGNTDKFIGKPLGELPFNARLYKLDSIKNVDEFILNLTSKFKDKAVIIDFWATWCAPCLQDMPFSKKLHETNKDLPVAYVYICTNSNSTSTIWKNKIAALQLPGTHIFMDEKMVEKLKSGFNENGAGFPTYVLLDINGKLRPNAIKRMQFMNKDLLKAAIGME